MFRIRSGLSDDVKDVVGSTTQTSTNAYADAVSAFYVGDAHKVLITVTETAAANGVTFRISGSLDKTSFKVLKTTPVAASGVEYETLTDTWRWLKIEIIDTVLNSHGTVSIIYHRLRV